MPVAMTAPSVWATPVVQRTKGAGSMGAPTSAMCNVCARPVSHDPPFFRDTKHIGASGDGEGQQQVAGSK